MNYSELMLFRSTKGKRLAWLQDVIDSMGDQVIVIDADCNVVLANRRKREKYGEDIIGKKCHAVFEGTQEPCRDCPTLTAIEERMTTRTEWEYIDREKDRKCVVDIVASPVMHNREDTGWAVEIVRDATIRRRIYEAILRIQEASTEEEIIDIFMGSIVERFGFDRARYYEIESKGKAEVLTLRDSRGMRNREEVDPLQHKLGESQVSRAIRMNEPVFFKICPAHEIEQRTKDEKNRFAVWIPLESLPDRVLLQRDEFFRYIDLPLVTGTEVIGKLSVDRKGSDWDIAEYDLEALGMLSTSIALAIEKSRLSNLEALRYVSTGLLDAERNLHRTLNFILTEGVQKLLQPDFGCIVLWADPKSKNALRIIAATDSGSEGIVLKLDESVCGQAVLKKQVINITEARSYPRYKAASKQGMRSNIAAPMIRNGEVIGVINAESRQINAFSKSHETLIDLLSTHAAIAIQNAETYQQLGEAIDVAQKSLVEKDSYLEALRHELIAPIDPMLATFALLKRVLEHTSLDDLLAEQRIDARQLRQTLESGINECKQLSFLLEGIDILGTERAEDLKLDLEIGQLFRDVIMPVVSMFQTTAKSENKNIRWSNIQKMPSFRFDKRRMNHVFVNLLTNAIKYSYENTDIEINGLEATGTFIRVLVTNYGMGIPEGWEERIFDRDVRAPNVDAAGFAGVGVGLTIASTIVQKHRGRICVGKNQNPTTFVVQLPII